MLVAPVRRETCRCHVKPNFLSFCSFAVRFGAVVGAIWAPLLLLVFRGCESEGCLLSPELHPSAQA